MNDICLESLAFHNLSACDGRFLQPIEMLTLRTMVGGLQMTNDDLEQYIDELLAENDEIKEEMEELKRETQKLKEHNQKLRSRINKKPKHTQVSTLWVIFFAVFNCSIQTAYWIHDFEQQVYMNLLRWLLHAWTTTGGSHGPADC